MSLKLNLGCSDALIPGFVNVDIVPPADIKVNLNEIPWPWFDNSVDHIRAHDIIEHLKFPILTMNEIWRVLKPKGTIEIFIPTTDGRGAFQDPQHISYWNRNSFFYYTVGIPERERFGEAYGIQARFNVLEEKEDTFPNSVTKLLIMLEAVK